MIKLTEVVSNALAYDPEEKMVKTSYSLRNLYINPKFIVSLMDNEKFNNMHQSAPVIESLIPEARFARLVISSGMYGTTQYDILGTPEQHLEAIKESTT